jgi:hypothetical protein
MVTGAPVRLLEHDRRLPVDPLAGQATDPHAGEKLVGNLLRSIESLKRISRGRNSSLPAARREPSRQTTP